MLGSAIGLLNLLTHGGVASFRFSVEFDNVTVGAFTECTLPNFQIDTEPIVEGGRNNYVHELPKPGKVGHITLKRGIVANDMLMDWYFQLLEGRFSAASLKSVSITMFHNNFMPLYRFNVASAFPVKWEGPSLRSGDNAIAVKSIELAHRGVSVQVMPVDTSSLLALATSL